MISHLELLVLENPKIDHVINNLNNEDRVFLSEWYQNSVNTSATLDTIVDAFIWCCTEGKYTADSQDPARFSRFFSQKAADLGITIEALSSLFFSHDTIFQQETILPTLKNNKPFFIVFEGIDGSGKSTQISMLRDKLKLMGRKVYVTAEPTNSGIGGDIRDSLSNNFKREPAELAALFLADRISHNVNPVWGIQKFLNEGTDVISDRYYYSSFAYQGLGTDRKWIIDMNINCPKILKPDLCIYLDADPRRSKQRVDSERAHLEIFENDELIMQQTRASFFEVFKVLNSTENIRIVDANRPVNVVADEVFRIIMDLKRGDRE